MLDLRRLRLLSELARRGTIAEVARVVGYTPSAISQSLLQLEREAGVPLLERDGRRVRLTPAAHGLVARTDRVLAELDAAEAELAADHGMVRGTVVIGSFPSAAAGLVVPAVADLCERHPELSCPVVEHEPEDGIPVLRSGDLDVLVSESYEGVPAVPTGGLEAHELLSEPLLLVLPRESAATGPAQGEAATELAREEAATGPALEDAATEPIRLESLAEAPWIAGLAGTQFAAALDGACRQAGFTPRIVHRADDARLIETLVEAGLGIGLVPALARTGSEAVRFAEATPAPPRRHVTALVRSGAARRPSLAAVLEALMRQASLVARDALAAGPAGVAAARDAAGPSGAGPPGAAAARDAAASPRLRA
jgi:DNA-binding transcriptional LysR family regulator